MLKLSKKPPEPAATVFNPETQETIFDSALIENIHAVDLAPWGLAGKKAYWCQWKHPDMASRNLFDIIKSWEDEFNWRKFIKPGSVCIDIGAHSGDTCIPMAIFSFDPPTGKRSRVIAIEPNPKVFPVLEINLALNNHLAEFTALRVAVTREDVDRVEIADHSNAGCNGGIIDESYTENLKRRLRKLQKTTVDAPGLALHSICEKYIGSSEWQDLGFVKMDCEGYDKEILRSSKDFLKEVRPTLFVEWFAWFDAEDDRDLFAAVEEIGYLPFDPGTLKAANIENRISDLLLLPKERV